MNYYSAFLVLCLITLSSCEISIKKECPLRPPSGLTITPDNSDKLLLKWTPNNEWLCYVLHKIDIYLNNVYTKTIVTMRPDFPIDMPKPCTTVKAILRSTDDSGIESESISASYTTEPPTFPGEATNRYWMVDSTRVIVTYSPELLYENCDYKYEFVHYVDTNMVYNVTQTGLVHMFNYVQGMLYCKTLRMNLTPILNGYRGYVWQENAVLDKFEVDVGPVAALDVTVNKILTITWKIPVYFEECAIRYQVEVINVASGEALAKDVVFMEYEYVYDYASDNVFCISVLVRVTALYGNNNGTPVTRYATLGTQENGSC